MNTETKKPPRSILAGPAQVVIIEDVLDFHTTCEINYRDGTCSARERRSRLDAGTPPSLLAPRPAKLNRIREAIQALGSHLPAPETVVAHRCTQNFAHQFSSGMDRELLKWNRAEIRHKRSRSETIFQTQNLQTQII